jgi:hypothetical protein
MGGGFSVKVGGRKSAESVGSSNQSVTVFLPTITLVTLLGNLFPYTVCLLLITVHCLDRQTRALQAANCSTGTLRRKSVHLSTSWILLVYTNLSNVIYL